jgi:hypothetical protein
MDIGNYIKDSDSVGDILSKLERISGPLRLHIVSKESGETILNH